MKILIIDDDKLTLRSLYRVLETMGHEVFLAENSEEAIKMIENQQEGLKENYDLIICDIMMPGISGLSMITVLRSVHLCKIPLIMMSTLTNKQILESLFKLGANDFISKPIKTEELVAKLEKYSKIKYS